MNNDLTEEQSITNDPSTVETKPRKKTMSEAALAANRANAKKCTGPKTREGKFKSSLNALKHGAYSHNFILKTEDAGTFENFSKSFIDEFQPATPSELELLKQLISAAWRRNRIAELIQLRLNNAIDTVIANSEPTPAAEITQQAYDRLEITQPSFARQQAHELRLANLFQRTLCRLNSIRDKKLRDKKLRNETKFIRDPFSLAA
ncbi:MAG: hypothetical protein NTW74_01810 [Acidobacteria bacterium]|nr:hypothetical protein [Acidobacteriota bacterium]